MENSNTDLTSTNKYVYIPYEDVDFTKITANDIYLSMSISQKKSDSNRKYLMEKFNRKIDFTENYKYFNLRKPFNKINKYKIYLQIVQELKEDETKYLIQKERLLKYNIEKKDFNTKYILDFLHSIKGNLEYLKPNGKINKTKICLELNVSRPTLSRVLKKGDLIK